jgi:putative ABC transport system substrate-binding protein
MIARRGFIRMLGSAAAWPVAVRAQQVALPVIGFMSSRSPEDSPHLLAAFHRGLREGGFIDGENVAIVFRWARGDYTRLPTLATELVTRRVNVISALGGPSSALAAKGATSTIPIVTSLSADTPGLVESFNRPGGNVTGVAVETDLMDAKRLGLLRDLAPGVLLFGALVNPNYPAALRQL